MIRLTKKQAKAKEQCLITLKTLQKSWDTEVAHVEADRVLCDLLIVLGMNDVVEEYEKVNKWYGPQLRRFIMKIPFPDIPKDVRRVHFDWGYVVNDLRDDKTGRSLGGYERCLCIVICKGVRYFGVAYRNPKDKPNHRKGRVIALCRALHCLKTGQERKPYYWKASLSNVLNGGVILFNK